jgi:hypothetical protein
LLKSVDLDHLAHKHPASISGGQQQCAAIARALANDPPTLIADEPTGNLDSKTAEKVIGIFEGLVDRGKTVLIVTHDITVARHASHMLILSDGELIDEQVERIFPDLSHKTMLAMTHRLKKFTFNPGQPVVQGPQAGLIIIEEGQLHIQAVNGRKSDFPDQFLDPDSLVSRADFLNCNYSLSAAGDLPLKLKMIGQVDLNTWLKTLPEAQAKLFDLRLKDHKDSQAVLAWERVLL